MPYVSIENLLGGVDRSRPRYGLPPGTLWDGINGVISRGGDFEKRKAFVPKYGLPSGTVGLARDADGLIVFGHTTDPGVPSGITYQRLENPDISSSSLTKLRSWDNYNGLVYAVAEFDDGSRHHYYDGTVVADWETQSGDTPTTGFGTIVRTHQRKMYSPILSLLWFSMVDDATRWDSVADSGAGFQNLSTHQGGSGEVLGLITYQNMLAAFSRRTVQIWAMADDEADNAPFQTINETGTRSPRSVIGFGDIDAFYLSDSGIRSIRARSQTNVAGVDDVGTSIDTLVLAHLDTLTAQQITDAISIVEPRDGRYWLICGDKIFVFSYFPSKKVSAWTTWEPGLTFTDAVSFNGRVYCRAGNTVYLYGGDDDDTYDSSVATLELPFFSMKKVGHLKEATGIDIAAMGDWDLKLRVDPNNEANVVHCGRLSNVSYQDAACAALGQAHFIAPVLTSVGKTAASVSTVTLYNELARSN